MLTVRVIRPNGLEMVKEVRSVMLRPGSETETGTMCVTYWTEDYTEDIYSGSVYVMNQQGKTVADYHLVQPEPKVG